MSKPRGCKFFKHVECEYNGCRGRVASRGHVEDCPFQLSEDEASSDGGEYSESENMYGGWKPVRAERNLSAKPAITASTHVEKPIGKSSTTDIPKGQVAEQQSTRRCPSNVPTKPPSNSGVGTIAKSGSSTLSENLRTDAGCGKPAMKSWAQVASSPSTIPVTTEPETLTASKESTTIPKETPKVTATTTKSTAISTEGTAIPKDTAATKHTATHKVTATPKHTPTPKEKTPKGNTTPKHTPTPKEKTPKESTTTLSPATGAGSIPEKFKPTSPTKKNKNRRR